MLEAKGSLQKLSLDASSVVYDSDNLESIDSEDQNSNKGLISPFRSIESLQGLQGRKSQRPSGKNLLLDDVSATVLPGLQTIDSVISINPKLSRQNPFS